MVVYSSTHREFPGPQNNCVNIGSLDSLMSSRYINPNLICVWNSYTQSDNNLLEGELIILSHRYDIFSQI